MYKYFVSISISELQQWIADDYLTLPRYRISKFRDTPDKQPSLDQVDHLFSKLPAFSIDDAAGVLIVEVAGPNTWGVADCPEHCNLELSSVVKFIPLTEGSAGALSVTWSKIIRLSEPQFYRDFNRYRLLKKSRLSERAGSLFVSLFVDIHDSEISMADSYINCLPRALVAAEHGDFGEIKGFRIDEGVFSAQESWIEKVFGYTRHKAFPIAENLKSFIDLGVISRDINPDDPFIGTYREVTLALNNSEVVSLSSICANEQLSCMSVNLYISNNSSEVIDIVTLGLFLRWKQRFHDNRSSVDALSIYNDVCELSGSVNFEYVLNALWMFGAYIGMEYVSPFYRATKIQDYPALNFENLDRAFAPLPVWDKKQPSRSADYLTAHQPTSSEQTRPPTSATELEGLEQKELINPKSNLDSESEYQSRDEAGASSNSRVKSDSEAQSEFMTKEAGSTVTNITFNDDTARPHSDLRSRPTREFEEFSLEPSAAEIKPSQDLLSTSQTVELSIGQRVAFDKSDGDTVEGKIVKVNMKTVTVKGNDGTDYRQTAISSLRLIN